MNESTSEADLDTDILQVLPPSSSDEDESDEPPLDGSKPVCYIGRLENDNCDYWSVRGKRLGPDVYKNCCEDITSHLSSFVAASAIELCPNVNERWLIRNRFGSDIDENAFLCGKHRSRLGIGFKGRKCCFPLHDKDTLKKGKGRQELRMISASNLKAIMKLHSTPLKKVCLPVGTVWCTKCRSILHPPTMEKYSEEKSVCLLCNEDHTISSELETPLKRPRFSADTGIHGADVQQDTPTSQVSQESQDSQEEYTPEEMQKDIFNKSIVTLEPKWTPLRHQVRTKISDLFYKTRDAIVRKAMKAIDVVLEEIAPGQSSELKEEIFKKHVELDVPKQIRDAVVNANGNVKIQLLSLVAGRDTEGHYKFTIDEMLQMFPGVTKHYVEMARNHANAEKVGLPITPGKYTRKRLQDSQINHFLDFLQHGNLVQDVASGTRSVCLSTGRKTTMPNVVRTVHKAELIRLYEAACMTEGHTNKPSTRTLWNILTMCPASQRKNLAGLDNVAAEGSDSFDVLMQVAAKVLAKNPERKEKIGEMERALVKGKRYLKGEYKSNCKDLSSEIADHCRAYALSDPKVKEFQLKCDHKHQKLCTDCENLKTVLGDFRKMDLDGFDKKECGVLRYDITEACSKIEVWKAHILTVIHQDSHKYKILGELDEETAFIIIDFAMKFLSRRYRESMSKWFGKSGNGMHIMCVVYKVQQKFRKRTYINFIGKSSQDVGAVMAVYESCLRQIKVDLPQISKIIDKSDNAGCYHTEILFTWKALWAAQNTGHQFIETMFNERQAGKDQCDRDSATAKRQMNYHCSSGHNIENAAEMNDALRAATAICGFSSCVMEISKEECSNPKNINNISKIHHVKYIRGQKPQFHVWYYYGIGAGKKYPVGALPSTPSYKVTVPFEQGHTFGTIMVAKKKKEKVFCAENMCTRSFDSVDEMLYHFDHEEHEYVQSKPATQLAKVADQWVKRFVVEEGQSSSSSGTNDLTSPITGVTELAMGWAIPKRANRLLTNLQKNFLNGLFDEGERTKSKVSGEDALKLMRDAFDPVDFLPLGTIKYYFSRRKAAIQAGKSQLGEVLPVDKLPVKKVPIMKKKADDPDDEEDENEEGDVDVENCNHEDATDETNEEIEEQRSKTVSCILSLTEKVPDLQADDWIAVDIGSTWSPGQFVQFDQELEELEVNFLHRSPSNEKWFVWPSLQTNGKEDKGWIEEKRVFYRLNEPVEGRREVLMFNEYEDVEKAFLEL